MSPLPEDLDERRDAVHAYICGKPDGILQSELWKELETDSRTCSRVVTELEAAGRVTREKVNGTFLIRGIEEKKKFNAQLLMAGDAIVPCVACTEECDVPTCKMLEDWIYELVFSEIK